MTEQLTCWETTRLSKHFISLDFMADRAVYRSCRRLAFDKTWKDGHHALAIGLCNELLEPLMEAYGPVSVADAFWPESIAKAKWPRELQMGHHQGDASRPDKHRWAGGEATVDIALYRLVDKLMDKGKTERDLRKAMESIEAIDHCLGRIITYPKTEFVCVTFKPEGAREDRKKKSTHGTWKKPNLRAHHVRVGRYFNLLDFCRSGRAIEKGIDLVPKGAEKNDRGDYSLISVEAAARSFAAALDPLVERVGRISVVRGMETAELSASDDEDDEHADLHRWDREGPWRLVFVLPQRTDPKVARDLLESHPHVPKGGVQPFSHPSDSYAVALVVDRTDYNKHRGLRLLPV